MSQKCRAMTPRQQFHTFGQHSRCSASIHVIGKHLIYIYNSTWPLKLQVLITRWYFLYRVHVSIYFSYNDLWLCEIVLSRRWSHASLGKRNWLSRVTPCKNNWPEVPETVRAYVGVLESFYWHFFMLFFLSVRAYSFKSYFICHFIGALGGKVDALIFEAIYHFKWQISDFLFPKLDFKTELLFISFIKM